MLKTIRSPVGIFVRKGKHSGHKIGNVIYQEGYPNYILITKNFKRGQIFYKEELRNYMFLSETAIEDAKKAGAELVIYEIIGFDSKSFYIVFRLSEFEHSNKVIGYDDRQAGVSYIERPRFYEFPTNCSLLAWLKKK